MSKVASSSVRFPRRDRKREANENDFDPPSSIQFPLPRSPLNAIPDPSQCHVSDAECQSSGRPCNASTGPSLDSKIQTVDNLLSKKGIISVGSKPLAAVASGRRRSCPESGSTRCSPVRSASRIRSFCVPNCSDGVKGGKSFQISKGVSSVRSGSHLETPQFDLEEEYSIGTDRNVQVLIRIRPLSPAERAAQGHSRCLRQENAQTLVWLGHPETTFTFDHVACETISQEKFFKVAGMPMVENCMAGYNSCMFAYGQTGSGKTYTMMGDIQGMEGKFNENCGLTPRIFDHLFSRIRTEEENHRDEKLTFSCKCSFLEIYNEQITDLLEPSSTNLQLREDSSKGVYVQNLTECSVTTVGDVVKLLLQGAVNRKMAATNMNNESSRSHSVFTCIIESQWEKNSVCHYRSVRLNLVDLAGSERQKASGAEGDRLKEAANINKSLSVLGFLIMSLVDLAHGKPRHIPYRESKLTFLLQDSLGGNSKTTIISNISPSTCSTNETLSTLKFAQRAKLFQNNARVNDEASNKVTETHAPNQHLEHAEASLVGALRREKVALAAVNKLEDEIAMMNQLALKREEDAQRYRMILRFREEKIKRLELLTEGLMTSENYFMEENRNLRTEVDVLSSRFDRNPELVRFARENSRLQDELRQFQDFYDHGERELLLSEVSDLRNQLLEALERNHESLSSICPRDQEADTGAVKQNDYQKTELVLMLSEAQEELKGAKMSIEELQAMNISLNKELKLMQEENVRLEEMMQEKNSLKKPSSTSLDNGLSEKYNLPVDNGDHKIKTSIPSSNVVMQSELRRLTNDLEESRLLNMQYQQDKVARLSKQQQVELVSEQVELEAAKTILQLQEELNALQLEYHEKLDSLTNKNTELRNIVAAKDKDLNVLNAEWEMATLDLTSFLTEGSKHLEEASSHVDIIASSFPQKNIRVSRNVRRAAEACIEKEDTILVLQRNLENAQHIAMEIELKLKSMKVAANAFSVFHKLELDKTNEELNCIKNCSMGFANDISNGLLNANEHTKKLTTSKELLEEKSGLIEEVEQIRFSLQMKNTDNRMLQDQMHDIFIELLNLMSFLEGLFLQVRHDVDGNLNMLFSEVLSVISETTNSIYSLQGSIEDLCSLALENDLTTFVLFQCGINRKLCIDSNEEHNFLNLLNENVALKQEIQIKEHLMNSSLHDHSLLQESTSSGRDIEDRTTELLDGLMEVQDELRKKSNELDDVLIQHAQLKAHLADTEDALWISNSNLQEAQKNVDSLSSEIDELTLTLNEVKIKKLEVEEQVEDQKEVVSALEREILRFSSHERSSLASRDATDDDLCRVTRERNQLAQETVLLSNKLDMAYSLADENAAAVIEARQMYEENKVYAERKDEEVKILEHSINELESTVDILEKKVCKMGDEVEKQQQIIKYLEMEAEALQNRAIPLENISKNLTIERSNEHVISRSFDDAYDLIRVLEEEKADQVKEVKQCRDHIAELIMHAEAQALHYQQKFKTLEALLHGIRSETSTYSMADKVKGSVRARGSGSPFRCMGNVVNVERDEELSAARNRVEDLENLAAARQKEVYVLHTKLAAAESMTHDVNRDLLGLKIELRNYANLIDQKQMQELVATAQQQAEDTVIRKQEIFKLQKKINDLHEEKNCCIAEMKRREANLHAAERTVRQLRDRDQFLAAQNEILKKDRSDLVKRVSELEEVVSKLLDGDSQDRRRNEGCALMTKYSRFPL